MWFIVVSVSLHILLLYMISAKNDRWDVWQQKAYGKTYRKKSTSEVFTNMYTGKACLSHWSSTSWHFFSTSQIFYRCVKVTTADWQKHVCFFHLFSGFFFNTIIHRLEESRCGFTHSNCIVNNLLKSWTFTNVAFRTSGAMQKNSFYCLLLFIICFFYQAYS